MTLSSTLIISPLPRFPSDDPPQHEVGWGYLEREIPTGPHRAMHVTSLIDFRGLGDTREAEMRYRFRFAEEKLDALADRG